MTKRYFVYILGNHRPTLYIGVTNNLTRRIYEHREGLVDGFSKRYGLKRLLYFEEHVDINEAIIREKQLKYWKRSWKLRLIVSTNSEFEDLYPRILDHVQDDTSKKHSSPR